MISRHPTAVVSILIIGRGDRLVAMTDALAGARNKEAGTLP